MLQLPTTSNKYFNNYKYYLLHYFYMNCFFLIFLLITCIAKHYAYIHTRLHKFALIHSSLFILIKQQAKLAVAPHKLFNIVIRLFPSCFSRTHLNVFWPQHVLIWRKRRCGLPKIQHCRRFMGELRATPQQ